MAAQLKAVTEEEWSGDGMLQSYHGTEELKIYKGGRTLANLGSRCRHQYAVPSQAALCGSKRRRRLEDGLVFVLRVRRRSQRDELLPQRFHDSVMILHS